MQNADGSYTLYFGYMNTNWLQEFDIPVGPDNHFEPGQSRSGAADALLSAAQSVPVHVSRCRRTSAARRFIWTLTANGQTRKAYASLKSDYEIDKQVISTEVGGDNGSLADALRDNIPPELKVEGS